MSQPRIPSPLTIDHLAAMKRDGEKIAMLTCYDATFAGAMDQAGVDTILVGDSLGMVVQGRKTTVGVTVEDIAYHVECVSQGLQRAFLLADLPFGSYHDEPTAMESAVCLMQAGAAMVKLEGAGPMVAVVDYLSGRGVLGLRPFGTDAAKRAPTRRFQGPGTGRRGGGAIAAGSPRPAVRRGPVAGARVRAGNAGQDRRGRIDDSGHRDRSRRRLRRPGAGYA